MARVKKSLLYIALTAVLVASHLSGAYGGLEETNGMVLIPGANSSWALRKGTA